MPILAKNNAKEEENKMNQMKAERKDENVILTLPVELLVFAQKFRTDIGFKISDSKAAGEYIAKHIIEYDEEEDGTTMLHRLLDGLFEEAYESGEEWLDEMDEEG
jgi:hypothetical protein